jgi:hypothetical protein
VTKKEKIEMWAKRDPVTAEQWQTFLAELAAKIENDDREVECLNRARGALALDVALGSAEAVRQADELARAAAVLESNISLSRSAVTQAEDKLAARQQLEAHERDRERRREIGAHMSGALEEFALVDRAMAELARHLEAAYDALGRGHALMRPAERLSSDILAGNFGPTMAACYYGLPRFIDIGNLKLAANRDNIRPLAAFARPLCLNAGLAQEQPPVHPGKASLKAIPDRTD